MINTTPKPNLSIIVAIAQNQAIGRNNDLIWHISDDLKRFKSLTSGHPVIMGRKTWDSLPKKPLPKRRNIVLTHDPDFHPEGADVAHTIQQAIELIRDEEETFIMGGSAIYNLFLPFTQRLYVTWVYEEFEADVFFPSIDPSVFRLISQTEKVVDEGSQLTYNYAEYERILGK